MKLSALALALATALLAPSASAAPPSAPRPADPKEALLFLADAEARLEKATVDADRAQWVYETFITPDTETLAAQADERRVSLSVDLAKQAARFDGVALPEEAARKMRLLKLAMVLPAPADPGESQELTQLVARMNGAYGKGKWCPAGKECLDLPTMEVKMADSRDLQELLGMWAGWRTVSPPLRKDYERYVQLANKGARELGYPDTGALWRSKYDMPPDAFARELDRLWEQVRPLYVSLHAYVRRKLRERYGDAVPKSGPIPAHLLGNMWAQSWDHVYPLVAPAGADPGFDLTERLTAKGYDAQKMVRTGEAFFTSLGFAPLPASFWERSQLVKPRDREVVCHASAWDIDARDDLRIKMCIQPNGEDFTTIHHELGHNFYQRAYKEQPPLFRDSANDGFHEAIGDTIALSITPAYLTRIGLLDREPDTSKDTGLLLRMALERLAFLPFGLMVDQWRWKVFSGEVPPSRYNQAWWELARKYQGVAPPVERTEKDFDPGAKYHVVANVPYARYFLAHVLQFQLHRSLAKAAGCAGPLHRCSIYANPEAGHRLARMLEMGQSKPWPEALAAVTGSPQMDAGAILEYFAPLKRWLDEQNKGETLGW